jgi:hypothetical protein
MRKMIKPIGQGSSMIDPNCTQNEIQPSFWQNAQSSIKVRSIDNLFLFWDYFSCLMQAETLPQSSSSSRRTAGAFGFLTFS